MRSESHGRARNGWPTSAIEGDLDKHRCDAAINLGVDFVEYSHNRSNGDSRDDGRYDQALSFLTELMRKFLARDASASS